MIEVVARSWRFGLVVVLSSLSSAAFAAGHAERIAPCFRTKDVELCVRFAADVDDHRLNESLEIERRRCEERLVAASGEGVFRCASDPLGAPGPDPTATAALGDRLHRAIADGDPAVAEEIYAQLVDVARRAGARECTAACSIEGQALLPARPSAAPALSSARAAAATAATQTPLKGRRPASTAGRLPRFPD